MSSPFLNDDAQWIWVSDNDDTIDPGQFVLFRKTFSLQDIPQDEILLHVSADTRYRLYLNGERLSFGPCKSYLTRWYYETVNITPLLRAGENVLSAKVLRFSSTNSAGSSMARSPLPGLILWCKIGVSRTSNNGKHSC
jgi:alpha-L-rhamnosidase